MEKFTIARASGPWGWSRALYFRRHLIAVLAYGNGTEPSGRNLTLGLFFRPYVVLTLPLNRVALRNGFIRVVP